MDACRGGARGFNACSHVRVPMTIQNPAFPLSTASTEPLVQPGTYARKAAFVTLALTVAAVQFSIAVAQIFLTMALIAWATTLVVEHRRPSAPSWMLPLL